MKDMFVRGQAASASWNLAFAVWRLQLVYIVFGALAVAPISFCSANKLLKYDLIASWGYGAPDGGVSRPIVFINGKFLGPTIVARQGDTLQMTLRNGFGSETTSLHFHGLSQKGTPFMDGVVGVSQCAIYPGKSFVYKFVLEEAGTFFYHSHALPSTADGYLGALVIHERHDAYNRTVEDEFVFLIQEWYSQPSTVLEPALLQGGQYPASIVAVLINGMGRPLNNKSSKAPLSVYTVKRGKTYRFRFVDAGAALDFLVSIDGHKQTIIGADATMVTPSTVTLLPMAPAQRYSVLVKMDQKVGNYWIRASAQGAIESGDGLAILRYEGAPKTDPKTTPWPTPPGGYYNNSALYNGNTQPKPLVGDKVPKRANKVIDLVLTEGTGMPMYMFNGVSYETFHGTPLVVKPRHEKYIYEVAAGDVVDIVVQNAKGYMPPVYFVHPLHLHGHDFWIMATGWGDFNYQSASKTFNTKNPVLRDVAEMLGGGQWIVLRFVADNPGYWLFHCHVEWHLFMGMAAVIAEAPNKIPPVPKGFPTCAGATA